MKAVGLSLAVSGFTIIVMAYLFNLPDTASLTGQIMCVASGTIQVMAVSFTKKDYSKKD